MNTKNDQPAQPQAVLSSAELSIVDRLREWVEDLKHERLVPQRISARRAAALEWAGLHADCTMHETQAGPPGPATRRKAGGGAGATDRGTESEAAAHRRPAAARMA